MFILILVRTSLDLKETTLLINVYALKEIIDAYRVLNWGFIPHSTLGLGVLRVNISKSPGNFMNCRENRYIVFTPPTPTQLVGGGGSFRGKHLEVTISIKFKKKVSQNAIILSDYTAITPGEPGNPSRVVGREEGWKGETDGKEGRMGGRDGWEGGTDGRDGWEGGTDGREGRVGERAVGERDGREGRMGGRDGWEGGTDGRDGWEGRMGGRDGWEGGTVRERSGWERGMGGTDGREGRM